MKPSTLTISAFALSLLLGAANASAFTFDDKSAAGTNTAAKFSDPDDNVPFPHLDDNNQPQDGLQQGSNGFNPSFGFGPLSGQSDAFERAQNRMQQ